MNILPPAATEAQPPTLFEGYEPPTPPVSDAEPMSADRRRTKRQSDQIALGVHPLTGGSLHPLASRHRDSKAPKGDPFTCGSCWFRDVFQNRSRSYPKCTYGLTAEMKYLTDSPRITSGAGTDVRAWWPACSDYTPGDSLSRDAARNIPSEET